MFEIKVVEKIKTHTLCSGTFPENHAIYEMLKNIVVPERLQITIWCIHTACWIRNATCSQAHAQALAHARTHTWVLIHRNM
jgi:hypothetical protein